MAQQRRVCVALVVLLSVALASCSALPEVAIFRNPCRVPIKITTFGDESGGPHGEPIGGGTIQAGSLIHVSPAFSDDGGEVGGAQASTLRSVHVEPSGVDFLVGDDGVKESPTLLAEGEFDVTIPVSACPKS